MDIFDFIFHIDQHLEAFIAQYGLLFTGSSFSSFFVKRAWSSPLFCLVIPSCLRRGPLPQTRLMA